MLETHTDHSRHSHALKLYTRRPQHRWLATALSPGGHYPSRAVHSSHCHHTWSLRLCPSADTSSQPRQHGPGQRTALAAPGPSFVPRSIAGSPPFQQRRPTPWLLSRQSEEGEPGGVLSKPRKEQGTRAPCLPPPEPGSLCLAASVQAGEAEQAVPGPEGWPACTKAPAGPAHLCAGFWTTPLRLLGRQRPLACTQLRVTRTERQVAQEEWRGEP